MRIVANEVTVHMLGRYLYWLIWDVTERSICTAPEKYPVCFLQKEKTF